MENREFIEKYCCSCGRCGGPIDVRSSACAHYQKEILGNEEHISNEQLKDFQVHVTYDAIISVKASSAIKARAVVSLMSDDNMYKASEGTWSIDEIEKISD